MKAGHLGIPKISHCPIAPCTYTCTSKHTPVHAPTSTLTHAPTGVFIPLHPCSHPHTCNQTHIHSTHSHVHPTHGSLLGLCSHVFLLQDFGLVRKGGGGGTTFPSVWFNSKFSWYFFLCVWHTPVHSFQVELGNKED